MKIALIPARYDASRFPGKLMKDLLGKSIILRTYEATVATGLFDAVAVVTDSDSIFNEIDSKKGTVIMSRREHQSGTDRIAEALEYFPEAEIIVNVQGDEPFTKKKSLASLLNAFDEPEVLVASLMQEFSDAALIPNPNNVKVVIDKFSNALLFSRSAVPYIRDTTQKPIFYHHIGIYAFRRQMLRDFPSLRPGPLELAEKLEGLRYLEHGIRLKMIISDNMGVGIDTPEDLQLAEKLLRKSTKGY